MIKSTSAIVYLIKAKLSIEVLLKEMPLSFECTEEYLQNANDGLHESMKDIVGYHNGDCKSVFIIHGLIHAVASMNEMIDRYEAKGLNIEPDAFDGNVYGAIGNITSGLYALIGIDLDDTDNEQYTGQIESVRNGSIGDVVDMICDRYKETIQKNVECISQI